MRMIPVDRIFEQRDIDAALYLLGRMLPLDNEAAASRRASLLALLERLKHTRKITKDDRTMIIRSYREIVG